MDSEMLVQIVRGPITESIHRGHIAVVHAAGERVAHLGSPEYVTFARSSAKLLQAIPVIESGAADAYMLSDPEIAILCASHSGELKHVQTVQSILAKLKLEEGVLQCGPHAPFNTDAARSLMQLNTNPTPLHNNCSGKHAGMLALTQYLKLPLETYMSPDHPIQRMMLETVSEMAGIPSDQIVLGTDGCGVPVFGLPIDRLALAFSRLGKPQQLEPRRAQACRRIIDCLANHPYYIAGSERFDSQLIEITKGRIIGKMGAEGVFALTSAADEIGIVVKVEDGAQRALYPTVVEILRQLELLGKAELEALKPFHFPAIKNWRGDDVGITRPVFQLRYDKLL